VQKKEGLTGSILSISMSFFTGEVRTIAGNKNWTHAYLFSTAYKIQGTIQPGAVIEQHYNHPPGHKETWGYSTKNDFAAKYSKTRGFAFMLR
jgi:hypothetical protein